MSQGITVYGEDGSEFFSTEYNPYGYLGIYTGNTKTAKSGSFTVPLPAGRRMVITGLSWNPNGWSELTNQVELANDNWEKNHESVVHYSIAGNKINWVFKYWDDPEWGYVNLVFALVVFSEQA